MARLFEYQGKQLLKKARVPIPQGEVATTPQEARKIAETIGKPVAIKSQVWAGGRGKAGGIKFAEHAIDAEIVANQMLGSEIKGLKVERLLIEEKLAIDKEYYVGVIVNPAREVRGPVIMFSTEGGMDIESVPSDKIATMNVDVLRGFRTYDALNLALKLKVPTKFLPPVAQAITGLFNTFKNFNCRIAEINPLVITKEGKVAAGDCRLAIDDSSVYRHPELGIEVAREAATTPTELDKIAWQIEEADLRGTCYIAQMVTEIKGQNYVGYHGMGGGGAILGVDDRIHTWHDSGLDVAITARTATQAERVAALLGHRGVAVVSGENAAPRGTVKVVTGELARGLMAPTQSFVLVTEEEIFGQRAHRRPERSQERARALEDLRALEPGDYVVHVDHGIGRYLGLERKTINGVSVELSGRRVPGRRQALSARLPPEPDPEVLGRRGRAAARPARWQTFAKTKARVQRRVRQMADELAQALRRAHGAEEGRARSAGRRVRRLRRHLPLRRDARPGSRDRRSQARPRAAAR